MLFSVRCTKKATSQSHGVTDIAIRTDLTFIFIMLLTCLLRQLLKLFGFGLHLKYIHWFCLRDDFVRLTMKHTAKSMKTIFMNCISLIGLHLHHQKLSYSISKSKKKLIKNRCCFLFFFFTFRWSTIIVLLQTWVIKWPRLLTLSAADPPQTRRAFCSRPPFYADCILFPEHTRIFLNCR